MMSRITEIVNPQHSLALLELNSVYTKSLNRNAGQELPGVRAALAGVQ